MDARPTTPAQTGDLAECLDRFAAESGGDLEARFQDGRPNSNAVQALARAGLLGLTIPPAYGGLGLDYLALGAAAEALGRIDLSHQISLTVHLALTAMTILQWGTPAQRGYWLPRLASGAEIATFALTEPGAGSDVVALAARAVPCDGGFRLSGEKTWISGANDSSLLLVFATINPGLRHHGISAFLVPRATQGLSTPALYGKLGIRAGDTGSVVLEDVFVPGSHVLGQVGEGFAVALSALATGLFTVGYGALGICGECRDLAIDILRRAERASPTAAGQLTKQTVAAMTTREATSRRLLERAAELKNRGLPSQQATGLAKWTAADGAVRSAEDTLLLAQQFRDPLMPTMERHLRNAKGAVIYGGTAEIHQTMQGAFALGIRRERPPRRPPLTAGHLAGVVALDVS